MIDPFAPPPGRGGPQHVPRPSDARLGPAAPWVGSGLVAPSKSEVVRAVQAAGPSSPEAVAVDGKQPSAVLVLIGGTEAHPLLVLTRRAWHLRSHTGEVSFPGGRFEDGDRDLQATALRETQEEIGLDPSAVEIVGELDRLVTVSSPAMIVPFVGVIEGKPAMVASPDEVDGIIEVSVAELLDPAIYRCEVWSRGDGTELEITFFELEGDTLWGATARMVRNLLESMTQKRAYDPGEPDHDPGPQPTHFK